MAVRMYFDVVGVQEEVDWVWTRSELRVQDEVDWLSGGTASAGVQLQVLESTATAAAGVQLQVLESPAYSAGVSSSR